MKFIRNATKGLLVISLAVVITACGNNAEGGSKSSNEGLATIAISGSTSVGPLAEKLAFKYEENNDVKIEINQIGSSAGITNAISGVSEIGMSSRDLKQEEIDSGLSETSYCLRWDCSSNSSDEQSKRSHDGTSEENIHRRGDKLERAWRR